MSPMAIAWIILLSSLTPCTGSIIFGFGSGNNWIHYDWDIVDVYVPTESSNGFHFIDPNLIIKAHEHGAKIIPFAPGNVSSGQIQPPLTANKTLRSIWVNTTIESLLKYNLDGVNFDLEIPIARHDPRVDWYTLLVQETTDAVHHFIPGGQVSVDVGWNPNNVDERNYDIEGLSNACDFLYIMSYDVMSQIVGRCIADSNSPIGAVSLGLQQYLNLSGITPEKLILGVPWYGFDYECNDNDINPSMLLSSTYCKINMIPFRGALCSDASGEEKPYVSLRKILDSGPSLKVGPRLWENSTASPLFNYIVEDNNNNNRKKKKKKKKRQRRHQLWYDDPESIQAKLQLAVKSGIAGFGPYEFSDLDYTVNEQGLLPNATILMWDVLRKFGSN